MPLLAPQQVVPSGLNPSMTAAAASQEFEAGDRVMLYIVNADTASHTATLTTPFTAVGLALADLVITIPNAERRIAGPFPAAYFAAADGNVDIVWSATTGMTIAVLVL